MKISLLVFIVAVFNSCDCVQHVRGVVIDSETQLPISKVIIRGKDTMNIMKGIRYTDSLGNFEYTSMKIGLLGCPSVLLSFERDGYIKTRKRYKSWNADTVIVVLEKQVE